MAGRRSLVVGIALLMVLAGCSGFGPGQAGPTQGEDTGDGTLDPNASPIYEPPLNTTDVAVNHVVRLREAGSFTYKTTVSISESNRSALVRFGRSATVDMDTGEMYVKRNETGSQYSRLYLPGNGTAYVQSVAGHSDISYNVTDQGFDTSRFAINGVPRFLDMFDLAYDGARTTDGETVYRYSADSADQVSTLQGTGAGQSKENLDSIEVRLYVTEEGLLRELSYRLSFESGGGSHNITAVTTYEDLGTTTVSAPSWMTDAKAAQEGSLTVTRTVTNESVDAELTLTAQRPMFDQITLLDGPGPLYNGEHDYRDAAASSAVTALFPPTATNATITVDYDEEAVPEGGESELALYRYVPTEGSWTPINATQDAEENTFTADLSKSRALVVLHEPTWESMSGQAS